MEELFGVEPRDSGACAPARLRRCAARMLRMSPLRGDQSVATPAARGVLLRKTKPVPARSRRRARRIVVRGLCPLPLPGPRRPWTRTRAFLS
jgi:hypothetical protein